MCRSWCFWKWKHIWWRNRYCTINRSENVEKVSFAETFAPTKKTIKVNQTQEQRRYIVTLEKVELASEETRLYVNVKNESKNEILFYASDLKLIVNNKQIEAENN